MFGRRTLASFREKLLARFQDVNTKQRPAPPAGAVDEPVRVRFARKGARCAKRLSGRFKEVALKLSLWLLGRPSLETLLVSKPSLFREAQEERNEGARGERMTQHGDAVASVKGGAVGANELGDIGKALQQGEYAYYSEAKGDNEHPNGNGKGCCSGCFQAERARLELIAHVRENGLVVQFEDIEICERIGEGAYGQVFRGMFRGEVVAVKMMKPTKSGDAPWKSFARELRNNLVVHGYAQTRNRCARHIVPFVGACLEPLALVHAFVPDRCIRSALKSGKLGSVPKTTLNTAMETTVLSSRLMLAVQVATGMSELHSFAPPMLHRDLTSSNVLVDLAKGRAMVADLGIAREGAVGDAPRSMSPQGPMRLRAPEVALGLPYSSSSDVFMFGMVLVELISGVVPFEELSNAELQNAFRLGPNALPPLPPSVPRDVAEIAKLCWQLDPSRRPSFAQLAVALGVLAIKCLSRMEM